MKSMKMFATMGMCAGVCLCSQAAVLLPGTFGIDPPQAPGPAPLATLVSPYSFGSLSGTVTSWVTRDMANPLGGLSFYYQINNTGTEEVSQLSASDFGLAPGAGFPIEVSTILTAYGGGLAGGVAPTTATRSPGAGSVVGFDFLGTGEINGGEHSVILVVNTTYQNYQASAGAIIDQNSYNLTVLGPGVTQTPEASTVIAASLLLLPLGASMLRIVRKRQPVE